ncbi:MAG: hypothetical protein IT336_03575 [Thermomicrobiales bacterium]|nr:hypothetical protein [Thermomicrobiales bacterium]
MTSFETSEPPASTPPAGNKIRQIPFDDRCAEAVADALGGTWQLAPFRLPSGAVYQVMIPGKTDKPATMLTLWPVIRRIDAIGGNLTVVFTDIATIDLVGEIEVQFRRSNRDYLIVARGGKVIVRA